jgi:MAF protein
VSEFDESPLPEEEPRAAARRVAWGKATAVGAIPDAVVIGADTIVVLDGQILGKPRDSVEALSMLERLRARQHEVITGLTMVGPGQHEIYVSSTITKVWMRAYGDDEIAEYIARGEPFDKAGGYAIQSTHFHPVARIEGCYLNVVGLPLCKVRKGLRLLAPTLRPTGDLPTEEECTDCEAASRE